MPDTHDRPPPRLMHIGVVLEQVRRQAELDHAPLAQSAGVTLDHLTGVLTGTRFPSRRFILRYARTCGADLQVLLRVWEDERQRLSTTTGRDGEARALRPRAEPVDA